MGKYQTACVAWLQLSFMMTMQVSMVYSCKWLCYDCACCQSQQSKRYSKQPHSEACIQILSAQCEVLWVVATIFVYNEIVQIEKSSTSMRIKYNKGRQDNQCLEYTSAQGSDSLMMRTVRQRNRHASSATRVLLFDSEHEIFLRLLVRNLDRYDSSGITTLVEKSQHALTLMKTVNQTRTLRHI